MAVREKRRGRDTAGDLALIAGAVWRFLAAALYASGRVGGTMAPFGVAAVAASGTGLGGVSALAGACLGYLATGGAEQGIRSAAACVAAFTIMFIFQDAPWAAGGRLAPFAALA